MRFNAQPLLIQLSREIEPLPSAKIATAGLDAVALQQRTRIVRPAVRDVAASLEQVRPVELVFRRIALDIRRPAGFLRLSEGALRAVSRLHQIDSENHAR